MEYRRTKDELRAANEQLQLEIDRRKGTEEALREGERFIRSTLDSLSTSIAILDARGVIQYTNLAWTSFALENACAITSDIIGVNYLSVCDLAEGKDKDLACMAAEGIRSVIDGVRESFSMEKPCDSPSEKRWFYMQVTRFSGEGPLRVVVAHENITDRKLAEEDRERLLHYLRERTKELTCLYQISNLGQLSDIEPDEMLRNAVAILPPAWQYPEITVARIALSGREFSTDDFRETPWMQSTDLILNGRKAGSVTVAYLEEKPQEQEGPFLTEERYLINTIAQSLGSMLERKLAEDELRASEDKFSRAFHSSPSVMTISTLADGRYLDVNEAFVDSIGYSHEEAIGRTAYELGIWADPEDRKRLIGLLQQGNPVRSLELQFRAGSGRIIDTLMSADIIELGGQQCILTFVLDISERNQVEREREQARRALEEVYDREHKIAETLQRNFLPDAIPSVEGFEIADIYEPALDEAAVGGDVYDIFKLSDGKIGIAIADVSGKGLRAAKYGAMVKYMLRAYAYSNIDPAAVMTMLNESMVKDLEQNVFVTCVFGILDLTTRRLVYANAGHHEPICIRAHGRHPEPLKITGLVLGVEPGERYGQEMLDLEPEDLLFLYTDGVTDAKGIEGRMDVEGLVEFVASRCPFTSAKDLLDTVMAEVHCRSGDKLADDVAMLAMKAETP